MFFLNFVSFTSLRVSRAKKKATLGFSFSFLGIEEMFRGRMNLSLSLSRIIAKSASSFSSAWVQVNLNSRPKNISICLWRKKEVSWR